jgi:hypothetical protein
MREQNSGQNHFNMGKKHLEYTEKLKHPGTKANKSKLLL